IIIVQTLCNLILCNQENIGDYIVNDNNEVQMNIHSDSDEIAESQDTLSPVKLLEYDDINVKVEFLLAEKRMTLNDLKRYVGDEVFKLPENVVQEVKIKVNGSLVGRGELVSIENGYGIEVTSWMVKETVHAE
ncbi:FliM/FliN family flagellar motor switch protein, partial [Escherichia coli]